jgi:hypothetical protein
MSEIPESRLHLNNLSRPSHCRHRRTPVRLSQFEGTARYAAPRKSWHVLASVVHELGAHAGALQRREQLLSPAPSARTGGGPQRSSSASTRGVLPVRVCCERSDQGPGLGSQPCSSFATRSESDSDRLGAVGKWRNRASICQTGLTRSRHFPSPGGRPEATRPPHAGKPLGGGGLVSWPGTPDH